LIDKIIGVKLVGECSNAMVDSMPALDLGSNQGPTD